jgi:hypothetical protein
VSSGPPLELAHPGHEPPRFVERRVLEVRDSGKEPQSFVRGLRALRHQRAPFLVGGALAVAAYCGIRRRPKDLDLFVVERDVPHILDILRGVGFRTEVPYPHWLAKAYANDGFVDIIFNSGNGAAPVDGDWFAHGRRARVMGVAVEMCPPEETIWSKAFVMERERFDGADVAHLLLACSATLDWARLLRRFGDHAAVLFAHVVLFGYVYPDEAARIPEWVVERLAARSSVSRSDRSAKRLCRGTLLSREQYLPDLARGWRDARLPPTGTMSDEAVALWTNAIASR